MILASAQLQRPDYVVLAGYFALMLGIGLYYSRRMQEMKDYFSGGNRIPWWLSGASFYMTSFSAATFIQYSALAYLYGWVAVTLYWVTVPATLVSVIFFARRWRRARIDSPVEYLETRYTPVVRQLFAWHGIVIRVIDNALRLVATGIFMHQAFNLSMSMSMLGAGLIIIAYTFLGGLWAVMVTDFVQFVVLAIGVIVLLPLSLREVGGLGNLIASTPESFFNLTHAEYNWFYIGANVLLFSLAFSSVQWSLIQRYFCVPAERDAYKVGAMVVVLNIITPPMMFLPAMAASQFLPGLRDGGEVYPRLCAHLLPAGMFGLIIAAMFSATMSTLSSEYNVCASVLTSDVYRRYLHPTASERELVWVGRINTLLVGLLALGLAMYMANIGGEGLFRNMVTLFSIATAPVAIPMIAGLLWRRVTPRAALSGFIAGVTAGLIVFFACPDSLTIAGETLKKENFIVLATSSTTLFVMLAVTRCYIPDLESIRRVDAFMERLQTPIGKLEQDRRTQDAAALSSPFQVVGISITLIGGMMLVIGQSIVDDLARTLDFGIGIALVIVGSTLVIANKLFTRNWESHDEAEER